MIPFNSIKWLWLLWFSKKWPLHFWENYTLCLVHTEVSLSSWMVYMRWDWCRSWSGLAPPLLVRPAPSSHLPSLNILPRNTHLSLTAKSPRLIFPCHQKAPKNTPKVWMYLCSFPKTRQNPPVSPILTPEMMKNIQAWSSPITRRLKCWAV